MCDPVGKDDKSYMWSCFSLLNMDATPECCNKFVPMSMTGLPDPWLPQPTVTKRGDVFFMDGRMIHQGSASC